MLSTALFNKPPFKNLIVNGLVLASDGQKMSKKKKNYPDPMLVRCLKSNSSSNPLYNFPFLKGGEQVRCGCLALILD